MKSYSLWLYFFLLVTTCFALGGSQSSGRNTCPQNKIPCDNSECIPKENWCNGYTDCIDGSDEQYCIEKYWYQKLVSVNNCNEKHFECRNGPCVPAATRCDGFGNCKDNSDEDYCDENMESHFEETSTESLLKYDEIYDTTDIPPSPAGSAEMTAYPSHVTPITSVSQPSAEDYYSKKLRESTNEHTANFDNNRAQPVSSRNTYNQPSGHSQSYDSSIAGQYPETIINQTYIHSTNNPYNSQENSRSGYPIGASVKYPEQKFSPTVRSCGSERNCRLENSSGIFVRIPPRKFPSRSRPSNSNSRDTSSKHDSDRYLGSGHSNSDSVSRPLAYKCPPGYKCLPTTVKPSISYVRDTNSQYGNEENFRLENSSGIFVRLPPRQFPSRFRPSNSDTRDTSSPRYFTSGYSNGASIRPPSHEFISTVRPSVSEARHEKDQYDGRGNSRLGNGIFVSIPPRKFPQSRYQGKTQITSTVSLAKHYTPAQQADYDGSGDGIQSDSGQPENYMYTPFYFKTNYARKFRDSYEDSVDRAEKWILDQRNASYGWGVNTPRALIALSLINNSFPFSSIENELMKKSLATHFGIQMLLLRNNSKILTNGKLATYINALLATCQNPKDFFNNDVTQKLRERTNIFGPEKNPFAYLTLCLTNTPVEYTELAELIQVLRLTDQDEITKDMKILATTALACFQRQDHYKTYLEPAVKSAYQNLLHSKLPDNSFGSIYSTALAAQALMSIDTNEWYDAEDTVKFLIRNQSSDGSFGNGDMLATYLILPILKGRSLLHLRNTRCDPVPVSTVPPAENCDSDPPDVPKIRIYYTVRRGYPEVVSTSFIYLDIPEGYNFSYAMVKAECLNKKFRFLYKKLDNGHVDVHTIADIPSDTELGFRWKLYVVNPASQEEVTLNLKEPYGGDIAELIPEDGQEFIYWYLPIFL